MVLVFKTSVTKGNQVSRLRPILNRMLDGNGEWNFDLEDYDNILRVDTPGLKPATISSVLGKHGFICEELS